MSKSYKIEKLVGSLKKKHRKLWIIALCSILLLSFMMTQNCGREEEEDSNVIPGIPGSGGGSNGGSGGSSGGVSFGEADLIAEAYFDGNSRDTARIIIQLEIDLPGNPQNIPRGVNQENTVPVRFNLEVKENNTCGFPKGNFSAGVHGVGEEKIGIFLGDPSGSENDDERPILRAYLNLDSSQQFASGSVSLKSNQGGVNHVLKNKQEGIYTMIGKFQVTVGNKSCSLTTFDPDFI